jgi:hypothetical protein
MRRVAPGELEALFRRIEQRSRVSRRAAWPVPVALGLAAAVFAFLVLKPVTPAKTTETVPAILQPRAAEVVAKVPALEPAEGPRAVSLQGRGELILAPHTMARLPPALEAFTHGAVRIGLQSGRIDATVSPRTADEPFSIVTPQLTVVVVGTRFSVTVAGDMTSVSVEHGRVRVEKGVTSVFVGAGESVRSDDQSLEPRAVVTDSAAHQGTVTASAKPCVEHDPVRKRACLERAARIPGLSGENALFSLALLERDKLGDGAGALSHLRAYERRYPNGALAPEVALALAATLSGSGANDAACVTAASYANRFPGDRPTIERLEKFCPK